jgi:hypothetical protein
MFNLSRNLSHLKAKLKKSSGKIIAFGVIITFVLGGIGITNLNANNQANFQSSDTLIITEDQSENLYASGDEVILDADAEADAILSAGRITINGDVAENLVIASGQAIVNGDVGGDVFLASGNAIINGNVNGDVRAMAGEIYINSDSIEGDLIMAGGKVGVDSDTEIGGVERIGSGENVSGADLPDQLDEFTQTYYSNIDSEAAASISALIGGASIVITILTLIGSILSAYFVFWLFPTFSEKQVRTIESMPVKSALFGLATYIVAPILGIILGISIIGWPILSLLIILGILASTLGNYFVNYVIGKKILKFLGMERPRRILSLTVGVLLTFVIIFILALIPVFGWALGTLISTLIGMIGVGAIIATKLRHMKERAK